MKMSLELNTGPWQNGCFLTWVRGRELNYLKFNQERSHLLLSHTVILIIREKSKSQHTISNMGQKLNLCNLQFYLTLKYYIKKGLLDGTQILTIYSMFQIKVGHLKWM